MRFLLASLAIGCVMLFVSYQEFRLASVAKPEAQSVTCKQLCDQGAGDNAHVEVGDFVLCTWAYVYEKKENSKTYDKIWVPMVPLDGEYHRQLKDVVARDGKSAKPPPLKQIHVILKSSKIRDPSTMTQIANADTVKGLVINQIESLGGDELRHLQKSYPGADFSKVLLLEHARVPSGLGFRLGMLLGGLVFLLIPVGAFLNVGSRRVEQAPPVAA